MSTKLFAARAEIRTWRTDQAQRRGLHLGIARHQSGFAVGPLADWDEFVQDEGCVGRSEIWVDIRPIRHHGADQSDRVRRHPDRLTPMLPLMRRDGLEEGFLGTVGRDESRPRVRRAGARSVRQQMTAGMWICWEGEAGRRMRYVEKMRGSPAIAEGCNSCPAA